MVSVKEVEPQKLVAKLKEELKKVKEIKPPTWALFVKSGVSRERPPVQKDFWHIRAASLLRRIYLNGPVGVEKLRTYYGGRKRRGTKPAHSRKASGSIIRKLLQQLEAAGLIEKVKRGRKISSSGRRLLDRIAYEIKAKK